MAVMNVKGVTLGTLLFFFTLLYLVAIAPLKFFEMWSQTPPHTS